MSSISAASGVLSFIPSASVDSYIFESFPCVNASSNGYNAISFSIQGTAGASLSLEMQTKSSCSATTNTGAWAEVNGITGAKQTITVPLSSFSGANIGAITSFVWSSFSTRSVKWQLGDIQFVCARGSQTSTGPSTGQSTRASSTTKASSTSAIASTLKSTTAPGPTSTAGCKNLLIDDWESQSRLTFLYYNAMIQPTSDDGTMASIVVANDNSVTLTPKDTSSYFYSKTTCVNAQNVYGGISLRIKAAKGTTFSIQLSSPAKCGDAEETAFPSQSTTDLGWTFDGTWKLYNIPFSKYQGLDLTKVQTVFFSGFSRAVQLGPMAFYCGNTVSEYKVPASTAPVGPSSTVPAPKGTASALVIDQFASSGANALGFWHGGDGGMSLTWGTKKVTIKSSDADYAFYTQVSGSCRDMRSFDGSYLHIAYSGSSKFTVALQQHNAKCDESVAPYPETWDSIEASRYASASDIYIPMSHFNINRTRVVGIALKGFYTTESVVLSKIEIVPSIPTTFKIPNKLPTGNLVFGCKRPNSFAFAIDDGDPRYAQEVMKVIKDEDIQVTFFTVGAPLDDKSTNLTNVYNEMSSQGHQIALHSYTHPKMEGLPDYEAIDWEYNNDIAAVERAFNGLHTPYFRPPFGNEGARMRQRLAVTTGSNSPYIVNWSVDVEDWLWATSDTPEKQLDAFKRDIAKGGNLVVMHYLYPSTVGYLKEFIQLAKATGKQLMRVDQCMEDPNAPAL
ncbi:glycosyl hydrolase [Pseudomassariella vexata]|uniref:Glycosyl hydrolase n=1 Tax=Pseudomassariella vexata TaxID=1141098 RepID=A0A1Y2DLT8_9PEZI|nr:glycosyl hydrolase [Pseudomassariella vexata]ORY60243.1 glycosyl hydrolase [Pseudomassariella vexata]